MDLRQKYGLRSEKALLLNHLLTGLDSGDIIPMAMKERCSLIYVIATINLAEGKRALYLEELNKIIPLVRSEHGCLEYGAAADVPAGIPIQEPINGNTVTIVERWSDVDALKIHLTAPHMQSYREAVKDYVKRTGIRVLAPL